MLSAETLILIPTSKGIVTFAFVVEVILLTAYTSHLCFSVMAYYFIKKVVGKKRGEKKSLENEMRIILQDSWLL